MRVCLRGIFIKVNPMQNLFSSRAGIDTEARGSLTGPVTGAGKSSPSSGIFVLTERSYFPGKED